MPDQVHGSGIPHSLRVHGEVHQAPLLLAIVPSGEGYISSCHICLYGDIIYARCALDFIKIIKW